jgi:hypothetical protein
MLRGGKLLDEYYHKHNLIMPTRICQQFAIQEAHCLLRPRYTEEPRTGCTSRFIYPLLALEMNAARRCDGAITETCKIKAEYRKRRKLNFDAPV